MRRVLSAVGVVSAVPVLIAVPVVTSPSVSPRPVVPHVAQLAVAPLPATTGVVADTGKRSTSSFTLVGATFRRGSLARGTHVELRTKAHGTWSSWTPLSMPDGGPDDGSADARAAASRPVTATDPLYVGRADGVQARVVDDGGQTAAAPEDLHVVLVDGGTSTADASPGAPHPLGGVAQAAAAQPTIYTRAQWGADESLRTAHSGCSTPSYGSTIKMGFVHHTDGANGYAAADVPGILRSIYAYHVKSNGWCDVGYNFLVDRFGRIWEGRYGGIDKPVIGAHTGGFNTDTFAASLIGTFSSTAPPAAMLTAVEKLFAWKFAKYYLDPRGKATVVAGSFSGSRYATGSTVTFNEVSGHRDADTTSCPGDAAYTRLATIRDGVAALMGAGFVTPTVSPTSIRMLSGQSFAVRAGVLGATSWTLSIADANGTTIKTLTGAAAPSGGLASAWDGTGIDGTPAPPGTYTLSLTGQAADGSTIAVPYTRKVTVTPPVSLTVPPTTTYGATVPVTGLASPRTAVTVNVQRNGGPAQAQTVTASTSGAWSTTLTADGDYSVTASVQGWTTPAATVKVAPAVTTPALDGGRTVFVRAGSALAVAGTGLPGSTVQLVQTPQGQQATTGPTVTVRRDGTWSGTSVTPSVPTAVAPQRTPDVQGAPFTVYPVAAPTASAPSSGYSGRAFTVTGNAGNAPVSVQLFLRAPGASSDTAAGTVTAATNGTYTLRATLPTTSSPASVKWRVVTSAAGAQFGAAAGTVSVQPAFAPTATGRLAGYYGYAIPIAGKAVPGDTVTLWTRAPNAKSWTKAATARANASTGAFSTSFILRGDTQWRVTSPSGATAPATVVVRPAVRVPSSAAKNAMVYGWGWAIPGQKVSVYRRPVGTTAWRLVGTVTAPSTGRWTGHWHLIYAMDVQVRSHGQTSPTATIRTK